MSTLSHSDHDDQQLVAAFLRSRREETFRLLYRRHAPVVYKLIRRLMGSGRERDAEEVLQTTWIRAFDRLSSLRWESSFRSWICGIAINCSREFQRRRRRLDHEELSDMPAATLRHHDRIDLERAIARLPNGYREVLVLHDIEGYTHEEIGSLLGIAVGTSSSQLSRARKAVREWLDDAEELSHERRAL